MTAGKLHRALHVIPADGALSQRTVRSPAVALIRQQLAIWQPIPGDCIQGNVGEPRGAEPLLDLDNQVCPRKQRA